MIDYKTIGTKIRKRRLEAGLSQERLVKTFIAILNSLSCSADEILCDELSNAERTYSSEISQLLEDCNSQELMIMADTLSSLKNSLRKQPSYLQSS